MTLKVKQSSVKLWFFNYIHPKLKQIRNGDGLPDSGLNQDSHFNGT